MKRKKDALLGRECAAYRTTPMLQADFRDRRTGYAIPGLSNVEDAKKWVDENKL